MTPRQLAFHHNMILHTTHVANWEYIRLRKQQKINYNNDHKNKSRIPHAYTVGDRAYLLKDILVGKNDIDHEGPYEIININTNGTVAIHWSPIIKIINVCHLVPHF